MPLALSALVVGALPGCKSGLNTMLRWLAAAGVKLVQHVLVLVCLLSLYLTCCKKEAFAHCFALQAVLQLQVTAVSVLCDTL